MTTFAGNTIPPIFSGSDSAAGGGTNPFSFISSAQTVQLNSAPAQNMNKPAGIVAGNLLIVGWLGGVFIGTPAGWTIIDSLNHFVYSRIATGISAQDDFPWPIGIPVANGTGRLGIYSVFGTPGTALLIQSRHIQQFGVNQYVVPELIANAGITETIAISCAYKVQQVGDNTQTPIFQNVSGGYSICTQFFLDSTFWPNFGYNYYAMCFRLETDALAVPREGYVFNPWQGGFNSASEGTTMRFRE